MDISGWCDFDCVWCSCKIVHLVDSRMWGGKENHWDSDSEEELQNETPLNGVNSEVRNQLIDIKHDLYDHYVYDVDGSSNESQDIGLLHDYLHNLNQFYLLTLDAQNNHLHTKQDLTQFPEKIQNKMVDMLKWISEYFRNNGKADTLPYSRMIVQILHEDPFVQK